MAILPGSTGSKKHEPDELYWLASGIEMRTYSSTIPGSKAAVSVRTFRKNSGKDDAPE